MCSIANPLENDCISTPPQKQTVELRSADCSADIYQLIAAMVVAARTGFEMENALDRADDLYVSVNIHNDENKEKLAQLKSLPDSCVASAKALAGQREIFEERGIFSPQLIDGIIAKLSSFNDGDLRESLSGKPEEMMEIVRKYWHCG